MTVREEESVAKLVEGSAPFHRILLKLSGEALMGEKEFGLELPVIEKIVEGMLGKRFFAETVLADQAWIHEPKKTVAQALDEEGLKVLDFERFALAE